MVCCGPLLRPVLEKCNFTALRNRVREIEDSSGNTVFHNPGRLGFSQLGEAHIPLQSITAPTSISSVTGNAGQHKAVRTPDNILSKESKVHPRLGGSDLPDLSITIEKGWDIDSAKV